MPPAINGTQKSRARLLNCGTVSQIWQETVDSSLQENNRALSFKAKFNFKFELCIHIQR